MIANMAGVRGENVAFRIKFDQFINLPQYYGQTTRIGGATPSDSVHEMENKTTKVGRCVVVAVLYFMQFGCEKQ